MEFVKELLYLLCDGICGQLVSNQYQCHLASTLLVNGKKDKKMKDDVNSMDIMKI